MVNPHKLRKCYEKATAHVSCTLIPVGKNFSQMEKYVLAIILACRNCKSFLMEDYHGPNVPQGFALNFWFEFVCLHLPCKLFSTLSNNAFLANTNWVKEPSSQVLQC